jgi:exosortase
VVVEKGTQPIWREHALAMVGLLPTWVVMGWFVSCVQSFWNTRPDLRFGWGLLVLSLFLIADRWGSRPCVHPRLRWAVVPVLLLAIPSLVVAQIHTAAFGLSPAVLLFMTVSGFLPLIFANLVYLFGGTGVRHFAFPFLFLILGLPLPSAVHDMVVGSLQTLTTLGTVELLNLLGVPAQKAGKVIQMGQAAVGIEEACSGIRGLQSSIMVTLFLGNYVLKSNLLRICLVFNGIVLAVFGNTLRALLLSYSYFAQGSTALAHDPAGWLLFSFTMSGVGILLWIFSQAEKAAPFSYWERCNLSIQGTTIRKRRGKTRITAGNSPTSSPSS